ncbi:MAG: hypothetical protein JNM19_10085 [Chitinophagaceae bacterium]|nr:hypothetical protein [Chitinophagaceae bacterium]
MTTLSRFTPAEILLLTEGTFPTLRQFLKLTFIDLFTKQVLKTELPPSDELNNTRADKYVVPGKNYLTYAPLPHEEGFTRAFEKYPTTKLLFRHLVQLAYKHTITKTRFVRQVCKSPALQGLVQQNFFQRLGGKITITTEGESVKERLNKEMIQLEKTLPVLIEENREELLGIAKQLKGNLFLLVNIPFEKWDIIDKDLLTEVNKRTMDNRSNSSGCGGGCSGGCGSWNSYNEYSSSFDSGCGSSDGNSSGCSSGDSGCSGCGGCGGGD